MIIIGLTGGIASGKSTVAQALRDKGVPVIDADQLAHEITLPNTPAYNDILSLFGNEILHPNSQINRQKLGQIVFTQPSLLQQLNDITHPRIAQHAADTFLKLQQQQHPFAVYEVPLLFENNLQHSLHHTILVSIPPELQLQRLLQRDPINKEQALARIQSQMPLEQKAKLAEFIIDNSGSLQQTLEQLDLIWLSITQK